MAVRERVSPWPFAALVAMTGVLFLYGAGWGLAPWWVGVLLLGVWGALLVLLLRWFSSRPRATVLAPVAAVAVWFVTVVGGARYLGW